MVQPLDKLLTQLLDCFVTAHDRIFGVPTIRRDVVRHGKIRSVADNQVSRSTDIPSFQCIDLRTLL